MLHSHYRSQDKGTVVVLRVQFTNLLDLKKKLNSFLSIDCLNRLLGQNIKN